MTDDIAHMTLEELESAVQTCTRCQLHNGRTQSVPGEGPQNSDIIFIGEGPGFHEDRQGQPFVGAAGKFLDELLASIGMSRDQVYIANVVKCRPPGNRDPEQEELKACEPYLNRQIEIIQPKLIVTLGRFSMYRYFPGQSISKIHGQPKKFGNILVIPMFHPAAALHQPKWRPVIEADFQKLPKLISEASLSENSDQATSAQQLSMF